jgi:hypothetical protein
MDTSAKIANVEVAYVHPFKTYSVINRTVKSTEKMIAFVFMIYRGFVKGFERK